MSIPDELLIAYADGELPEPRRAEVAAAVAADPETAARLRAHQALAEQVRASFAGVMEEAVPERLLAAASDTVVAFRPRRPAPPRAWWAGAAAAASLAIGVVVGHAFLPPAGGLIGADMAARGALARALDTQLASAAQASSPVRIGLSFRAVGGGFCRTFEVRRGGGVAGLACRAGQGWSVRMAVPEDRAGAAAPAYRTAASPLPAPVAELAQSLAADRPLDAAEEVRARADRWR